jgi:hypothetical protein
MGNRSNLRPGDPGCRKGSKNKLTEERGLLLRAEKCFNSAEYWERSAWPRILKGRAPHLELYFLQRIYGKPVEAVAPAGEVKRPIRIVTEVVRDKPLAAPTAPDKPALPGQLRRLPFRAGDGGQAPIDIGVNDATYRTR